MAWVRTGSRTSIDSRTARGDPGRLTTSVVPTAPATPRESMPCGVFASERARSASAMPGTSRSITRRVASGVTSFGERPVPPVVNTTFAPPRTASRIAFAIFATSSGTSAVDTTSWPASVRASRIVGPLSSARSPAAPLVLTVMTPARTTITAGSLRAVLPAPAAALRDEAHVGETRPALDRLQHVVEGQAGHDDRRECLHLHARGRGRPDRGLDRDAIALEHQVDARVRERQRVSERDEVGRAFRGHDPGDAGCREHVALLCTALH